ncbi:MAG: sigma-70 family RNA polymerase sigma factor [Planctomycetota bacterium]|nr:MAG: sigma-70 family RNA polymerase sigma factor [Planctomycetota bacterium]
MLNTLTTGFVQRLKDRDETAWFELWDTFGPVLRAQLTRWGKGRIGPETVRDLSQETLAALSDSIERYDPSRGARFSTWLLAIAKHTLGDEIDRRMALKRGAGSRGVNLDETWMRAARDGGVGPDADYESAVFGAKVAKAVRLVERDSEFLDFEIFRRRVIEGQSGKAVAEALGVSEPTVSRRLAKVRDLLRSRLREVVATYSFTEEEMAEPERNGLVLNPTKSDDALFDEAIGDICRRAARARDPGAADPG